MSRAIHLATALVAALALLTWGASVIVHPYDLDEASAALAPGRLTDHLVSAPVSAEL